MDLGLVRELGMCLVEPPALCNPTGLQQGDGGSNSARCCAFTKSLLILRSVSVMAEDFVFSELFCTMHPPEHPSQKQRQSQYQQPGVIFAAGPQLSRSLQQETEGCQDWKGKRMLMGCRRTRVAAEEAPCSCR